MAWLDILSTPNLAVADRRAVQAQNVAQEKEVQQKRIDRKRKMVEKDKQNEARAQAMLQQLEQLPNISSNNSLSY